VSECRGTWAWLGDPRPGDSAVASRALAAERLPRLLYGPTTWRLVHDGAPKDADGCAGYHLRLDTHFSTLVGVVGAPLHVARSAELRHAVEPLFVADDGETQTAVAALLDAAGVAIDGVLGG
jgi:hypothetical protein